MGNTWLNAVLNSSEVDHTALIEVNDAIARQQAEKYSLDQSSMVFDVIKSFETGQPVRS